MSASDLLTILIEHSDTDEQQLREIFEYLPKTVTAAEFRDEIVNQQLMTFTQVMTLFVEHSLLPKSQSLLNKIKLKRENKVEFKPKKHVQRFYIGEHKTLKSTLDIQDSGLSVDIPKPEFNKLKYSTSDEKQAVMLAVELVQLGELNEAEVVLLETLDSFIDSSAAIQLLCWLYLCTKLPKQVEIWTNKFLEAHPDDPYILEILCLAEQSQNKHLLASAHYQILVQSTNVKTLWYLLLAFSQELSMCHAEAIDNYRIYIAIANNEDLKMFATHHIQELAAK